MRVKIMAVLLCVIGMCFAGGWVNGYVDKNGKYHAGYFDNDYTTGSSGATNTTTHHTYTPPTFYNTDSYKPKTEYVRPYVKDDGTFVNGYWRSKKSK